MRNGLPSKIRKNESAIVNLDDKRGPGTHWVAYKKRGRIVKYYDSFGNLPPPLELRRYFCPSSRIIQYNHKPEQKPNEIICGHLSLAFLQRRS